MAAIELPADSASVAAAKPLAASSKRGGRSKGKVVLCLPKGLVDPGEKALEIVHAMLPQASRDEGGIGEEGQSRLVLGFGQLTSAGGALASQIRQHGEREEGAAAEPAAEAPAA